MEASWRLWVQFYNPGTQTCKHCDSPGFHLGALESRVARDVEIWGQTRLPGTRLRTFCQLWVQLGDAGAQAVNFMPLWVQTTYCLYFEAHQYPCFVNVYLAIHKRAQHEHCFVINSKVRISEPSLSISIMAIVSSFSFSFCSQVLVLSSAEKSPPVIRILIVRSPAIVST